MLNIANTWILTETLYEMLLHSCFMVQKRVIATFIFVRVMRQLFWRKPLPNLLVGISR